MVFGQFAYAMLRAIFRALSIAFGMGWEILWPLILGFALSGAIQAVVSREQMSKLLPNDAPRTLLKACGLGAASSSCSYAAVALSRSIFRKGANFTATMAFEMASTNLVIELGILMVILLGWQFAAAEFIGGPIMIILLAILFRRFLSGRLVAEAQAQANKGIAGRMEGHAAMEHMAVSDDRSILQRLVSSEGFTATSHYFIMDWLSIWTDIALGLLIAGALAAWVPDSFWRSFFFVKRPLVSALWGPLVGPLIAVISFVCSVGNVPLAAVLWNGGISFGGAISFIFADLIVVPILNIYRKYYGWRMAGFLFVTFYIAMVVAGLLVEGIFAITHLTPKQHNAQVVEASISWNYTTVLNIIFLAVAGALVWRAWKTGGFKMIGMMNRPEGHMSGHHS